MQRPNIGKSMIKGDLALVIMSLFLVTRVGAEKEREGQQANLNFLRVVPIDSEKCGGAIQEETGNPGAVRR